MEHVFYLKGDGDDGGGRGGEIGEFCRMHNFDCVASGVARAGFGVVVVGGVGGGYGADKGL